ncbi:DUF6531 domain-containing protein [Frankia sp. AgPm24]|uniref:DUF6531 domain-containing protein n=1 Tax=Frankia sp. AgPm24 TaxID=631128 RepID=UPI00200D22F5|nr:DUF6531 domain-containing protein [Frankia sp. AgPm24]MCK9923650.1 DUF6531 domain-containing protein [Frankia sp. AgPm24]
MCTANGNLVEQEIDLPLPGRVGPAGWRRTYNSRAHDRPGAPGVDRSTQLPLLGATLHADGAGFRFTRGPGETWWYDEAGQPPRRAAHLRVDARRAPRRRHYPDGPP